MAEEKSVENQDVQFETMPGADPVSKEEKDGFGIDLSFEENNEDSEETDDTEETAEENSEEEEETVAETEGEIVAEKETKEPTEEVLSGDDGELQEEPVDRKKSPMVPKSRLDEVLAKQKALQKQLDDQNQKKAEVIQEAPEFDFSSKEIEYQQLVLDGESDKATSLRNEMRAAEKQQVMFEVQQQMGQTVQQSQEVMNLQTAAKEIEASYPILDENSPDYDAELQKEVIDLRDAFVVQGYDASDALKKAATYTLAVKAPELLNVSEESVVASPNLKEVNEKKKQATVTKKLAAANAQPPELKGESNSDRGESTLDVKTLSDDEFSALPEETLRRMRGDFG
jgi:hypothetical protein|tara:strand:+ start:800 stop:1822 length:1023 start_codon:yes stop_codon:yes gene_type:complete